MRMIILILALCTSISLQALEITISTANNPAAIQVVTLAIDEGVVKSGEITNIQADAVNKKTNITIRIETKKELQRKMDRLVYEELHSGDSLYCKALKKEMGELSKEINNTPTDNEIVDAVFIITKAAEVIHEEKQNPRTYVSVDASKKYENQKRVSFLRKLGLLKVDNTNKQIYLHHPEIPSHLFLR